MSSTASATVSQARSWRSSLAQGVVYNWASLVLVTLCSILLTPVMIRHLGAQQYGMWVLIMSLVDQYGLLDMGMGAALSRYAGLFDGARDRTALDEVFCTTLTFTVAIAGSILVLSGIAAVIVPPFFGVAGPDQAVFSWLIALLGSSTAMAFPERIIASYLRGLHRFDLTNIASTSAVLVRAALIVGVFTLGWGVIAVAIVTLATGVASLAAHYGMLRRADPLLSISLLNARKSRFRELFSFSVYVFIASVGVRLTSRIDSIVIARILSVAAVTPFSIASRLMDNFSSVLSGVHGPLMTQFSVLHGRSDPQEFRRVFLNTSRLTVAISCFVGALFICDGHALLTLWLGSSGVDIDASYRVLVVLTTCYVSLFAQLPSWTAIYARGRHQPLAWLVLAEGLMNLGLSVYWGRHFGIVGVAMGTAVPALIHHLVILPWYALRIASVPSGAYLKNVVGPLVSGAVVGLYCWLVPARSDGWIQSLVIIFSQVAVFLAASYAVALAPEDKRFVAQVCCDFRKRLRPVGETS